MQFNVQFNFDQRRRMFKSEVDKAINAGKIYAESSLSFMHCLYDVAIDYLLHERNCRIDVIVLRRYLPNVLESFTRYSTGPECLPEEYGDLKSIYMWLDESAVTLTEKPSLGEIPRPIHECIYNVVEMETKAQWFIRNFSGMKNLHIHEFRTEEITTPAGLDRLLNTLQVNSTKTSEEIACQKVNLKPGDSNYSVESIESFYVPKYLEQARKEKKYTPFLPHMKKVTFPSTCPE